MKRQRERHTKLREIWDAKRKELGLNQEKAAKALGYRSQSSVSQYLRGDIPLNVQAAVGFAKLLEVDVSEIWDDDMLIIPGKRSLDDLSFEEIRRLACENLSYDEQIELARQLMDIISDSKKSAEDTS